MTEQSIPLRQPKQDAALAARFERDGALLDALALIQQQADADSFRVAFGIRNGERLHQAFETDGRNAAALWAALNDDERELWLIYLDRVLEVAS